MYERAVSSTGTVSSSVVSWLCIPEDQWQIILSFVTCSDLLELALVSTHLRSITTRTYSLITEPQSFKNQRTGSLLSKSAQTSSSSVDVDVDVDRVSCFTNNPLSCYNNDRPNKNNVMLTASASVSSVKSLTANYNYNVNVNNVNNETDSKKQQLTCLFQRFKYLRTVILHDLSSIQDSILPIINTCAAASTLKHLELHGLRILKDGHVLKLPTYDNGYTHTHNHTHTQTHTYTQNNTQTHGGAKLRYIAISGTLFCSYQNVLKSFTTFPNLKYIQLSGCKLLNDADVQHLINTRTNQFQKTNTRDQLHTLSLSDSSQLVQPIIKFRILHSLDLSKCPNLKKLTNIDGCPNLLKLNLSYCTSLGDQAVSNILSSCPMLELLDLTACGGLKTLTLVSDSLKVVDLDMCPMLETVRISCDRLQALKISVCAKLKEFSFDGTLLKELDLSLLPMSELKIVASSLQNLNLSGCSKLNDSGLELTCPKLQSLDICGTDLNSKYFQRISDEKIHITAGGTALSWDQIDF